MKFNEKIYALRRKKGWSQEELANELEVSRQSVYKWESGENVPDVEKIKKLAKIFNVSLDTLLLDERDVDCEQASVVVELTSYQTQEDGPVNDESLDTAKKTDEASTDTTVKCVAAEHSESSDMVSSSSDGGKRIFGKLSASVIEIIKLVINCITVPLLFIRYFHEVAVLPGFSASGESITTKIDHYYSVYDKIAREGWGVLVWICVVITAVSILFCVLNILANNKILKITGYAIWGVSLTLFLVLLFMACSISYAY